MQEDIQWRRIGYGELAAGGLALAAWLMGKSARLNRFYIMEF